jgi:N-methylhydantoinase B/oxoprolinase/acetone carboxylase alpha subunit
LKFWIKKKQMQLKFSNFVFFTKNSRMTKVWVNFNGSLPALWNLEMEISSPNKILWLLGSLWSTFVVGSSSPTLSGIFKVSRIHWREGSWLPPYPALPKRWCSLFLIKMIKLKPRSFFYIHKIQKRNIL